MHRKHLVRFLGFIGILIHLTNSVYAEKYLSAELPILFSRTDSNAAGSTKVEPGVSLNLIFYQDYGAGFDLYTIDFGDTGYTLSDQKVKFVFLNALYLLPVTRFRMTLGAGMGESEFDCTKCQDYFNPGLAMQIFGQLGIPLLPYLDAVFSYHLVSSTINSKISDDQIDVGGQNIMVGIGLKF